MSLLPFSSPLSLPGVARPARAALPRRLACLMGVAAAVGLHAPAQADPLPACLSELRAQAPANRVSVDTFDRFTAEAQLLERVITSRATQAEVVDNWWDYVPRVVDTQRVSEGRDLLERWQGELQPIAQRFGVDPSVIIAIWGIETNYGATLGSLPLLDVWITRACTERRPLWRANVYASLRLLRDGVIAPEDFRGSWGGAFGLTQFIPTSYEELGADGDGDGRVDLMNSVPDALASTANHLARRTTWRAGLPAVIEVELPASLRAGLPELDETWRRDDRRTLSAWAQAGARAAHAQEAAALAGSAGASLFLPTGRAGPAFLVTDNFQALLAYNRSTKYALSVALLAQRLDGREATLARPWPTDDPGLGRDGIRELQDLLLARGHDIGRADGIPGALTRAAVRTEQERLGLAVDGRTSQRVLERLRQGGVSAK